MPRKGTKKVRRYTRKSYLINDSFTGLKIEDPFAERTQIGDYYRNKPKKRK